MHRTLYLTSHITGQFYQTGDISTVEPLFVFLGVISHFYFLPSSLKSHEINSSSPISLSSLWGLNPQDDFLRCWAPSPGDKSWEIPFCRWTLKAGHWRWGAEPHYCSFWCICFGRMGKLSITCSTEPWLWHRVSEAPAQQTAEIPDNVHNDVEMPSADKEASDQIILLLLNIHNIAIKYIIR